MIKSAGIPDFIIAGAPKCGTTALCHHLEEHPEVVMCGRKEPRFFTKLRGHFEADTAGPLRSGTYERGFDWYDALYPPRANGELRGEGSTMYFSADDAPALMHKANPRLRLVFMLRDPVERAYSHYWQEVRYGLKLPSFEALCRQDHPRLQYYMSVSRYATNLRRFAQHFSIDQMLVVLQSDFARHPAEVVQRVYAHIGAGTDFVPDSLGRRFNDQMKPRVKFAARLINKSARLRDRMPTQLLRPARALRRAIMRINADRRAYPPLSAQCRQFLKPHFSEDVQFVEGLLGRSLPEWKQ